MHSHKWGQLTDRRHTTSEAFAQTCPTLPHQNVPGGPTHNPYRHALLYRIDSSTRVPPKCHTGMPRSLAIRPTDRRTSNLPTSGRARGPSAPACSKSWYSIQCQLLWSLYLAHIGMTSQPIFHASKNTDVVWLCLICHTAEMWVT